MTALGVVLSEQSADTCRYCGGFAVSVRMRFYLRKGSGLQSGETWAERHDCPALGKVTLSELVDSEVFGEEVPLGI